MIRYVVGNMFESTTEALVNTVNTVGVMGKGIALQFKKLYPNNFRVYQKRCKEGTFEIGQLIVVNDRNTISGEKIIINFPTKTDWRKPSSYSYIEQGLIELVKIIKDKNIRSIAIPPLGSGNGGLKWHKVKEVMETELAGLDCEIIIYEPNARVQEVLNKERVKLTPARAMLIYMLFELVKNGEFVSEFASEKLCYFLQRFGGKKYFKLEYTPNFYGPYSGKVKHVLNHLNGSYVMGYAGKDKKPFEELSLLADSEKEIIKYISENKELKEIVEKTSSFLTGFYSYFALELLSTVDYISQSKNITETDLIKKELSNWSSRKQTLFSNEKFIDISINRLEAANLV